MFDRISSSVVFPSSIEEFRGASILFCLYGKYWNFKNRVVGTLGDRTLDEVGATMMDIDCLPLVVVWWLAATLLVISLLEENPRECIGCTLWGPKPEGV